MRSSRLGCVAVLVIASLAVGCSNNLLNKAQQYELAGNDASALLTYRQALARIPASDGVKRSQLLTRIGDCLYRLGRYPEAYDSLQKAVDADPKNALARLRLGHLLLEAGAPERARKQALLVLNTMAKSNEALSLLGAAWDANDKPELAKKAYEQVLQADPHQVKVAVALADIYDRENNPDKAREILKSASKARPASAMPWLALARLEEEQGNGTQAEAAYRHAIMVEDTPETNLRLAQFLQRSARVTEAEQVLRKVDSQQRNYPVALGDFQLSSGHPAQAIEQYRAALEATAPRQIQKHLWTGAASIGQAAGGANKQAAVVPRILEADIAAAYSAPAREKSLRIRSIREKFDRFQRSLDDATADVLRAEIELLDNNLVMAQISAQAAVEAAPDSPAAHYVLGEVAAQLGESESAEKEWQTALDNDGHYMPARLALAEAALAAGDAETADENARAVVRQDPGDVHALIIFAKALLMEGKPTPAAIMAARASAMDPASVEPALLAGEIALNQNQLGNALLIFEKAVAEHPDSEEAIDGLLKVYRRGSVSYSSLEKMEKAAEEPPASSTLMEIAGRLYADHGWYNDAIRALSKSVAEDPGRVSAARMLAHLQMATGDFAQASKVAEKTGNKQPLLNAYRADATGNWQQAAAEYERAIREGDRTGVAANNLAWLYAAHGTHLDQALLLANSALKVSPSDPAVLDTVGFVHLQRREYSKAVETLQTAARLSAADRTPQGRDTAYQIRKHLSDAYFRSGQTIAAEQIAQNRGPFALK